MPTGRLLMLLGAAIFVAGVLIHFNGRIPLLGRLPGDIRVEREGFSFYFPLMTCILISAVISFLLWIFRK